MAKVRFKKDEFGLIEKPVEDYTYRILTRRLRSSGYMESTQEKLDKLTYAFCDLLKYLVEREVIGIDELTAIVNDRCGDVTLVKE